MALIMQGTISQQLVRNFVFIKIDWLTLKQWCSTLSPFATCGDGRFKCGNRNLFRNVYLMGNTLFFSHISVESGDRENLVGHHCFKETVHKNATLLFQSCLNKISTLDSTQETKQIRQFMTILRIQKSGKIWLKKRH